MDIHDLTPELAAAAQPVTVPLTVTAPTTPAAPAAPDFNATMPTAPPAGPVGTDAIALAPPTAASAVGAVPPAAAPSLVLDKFRQGVNSSAVATPAAQQGKPGMWAKQILSGVMNMFAGGSDALGDIATAQEGAQPGEGILTTIGRLNNAKRARQQQQEQFQTQQDRERAITAKTNIDTHYQEILLHNLQGKQSDAVNDDAIANGKQAVQLATTPIDVNGEKIGGAAIIAADISEQQLVAKLQDKSWDPTKETFWATGKTPVYENGKQKLDANGNPLWSKTYTIIATPAQIVLDDSTAKFLNDNHVTAANGTFKSGDRLPGALGMQQFQLANNNHSLFQKLQDERETADLARQTTEQKLASASALKDLGPDFFQIAAQSNFDVNRTMGYLTGQHMIPDPTGKNPQGIVDPGSADYAKAHSGAGQAFVNYVGGIKDFITLRDAQEKLQTPSIEIKDLPKNEQEAAAQTAAAQVAYKKSPTPVNKWTLDRATQIQAGIQTTVQNERKFSADLQQKNAETLKGVAQFNELAKYGIEKINQQWTDPSHGYAGTRAQIENTRSAIQAGADGNGLMTSMTRTMEILAINHAAGISRISPQEAHDAGLPGGWAEQWDAWATKAGQGKLTTQLATEGQQLLNVILQSKYDAALQASQMIAANANHLDPNQVTVMDMSGQPVSLQSQIKAAALRNAPKTAIPSGNTRIFASRPDAAGNWYHDIPSANLAAAQKIDPQLQVIGSGK